MLCLILNLQGRIYLHVKNVLFGAPCFQKLIIKGFDASLYSVPTPVKKTQGKKPQAPA